MATAELRSKITDELRCAARVQELTSRGWLVLVEEPITGDKVINWPRRVVHDIYVSDSAVATLIAMLDAADASDVHPARRKAFKARGLVTSHVGSELVLTDRGRVVAAALKGELR